MNLQGYHGVKPGWTRVSFPYYMPRDEFRFILAAVDFLAAHGHRFLPLYSFDWATGNWAFRRRTFKHHVMTEELLRDDVGSPASPPPTTKKTGDLSGKFQSYLETATRIALSLPDTYDEPRLPKGLDPDIVLFRV